MGSRPHLRNPWRSRPPALVLVVYRHLSDDALRSCVDLWKRPRRSFRRAGTPGRRGRSWKRCHRLALPPTPEAKAIGKEKPRRRWGQSGAFNGRFALGWVRPGHRTERRGQDDTPKRKMVRARLPSIAKRLIQFECGAHTTVQFRGAIASRRQPTSPRPGRTGFTKSSTMASGSWPDATAWVSG